MQTLFPPTLHPSQTIAETNTPVVLPHDDVEIEGKIIDAAVQAKGEAAVLGELRDQLAEVERHIDAQMTRPPEKALGGHSGWVRDLANHLETQAFLQSRIAWVESRLAGEDVPFEPMNVTSVAHDLLRRFLGAAGPIGMKRLLAGARVKDREAGHRLGYVQRDIQSMPQTYATGSRPMDLKALEKGLRAAFFEERDILKKEASQSALLQAFDVAFAKEAADVIAATGEKVLTEGVREARILLNVPGCEPSPEEADLRAERSKLQQKIDDLGIGQTSSLGLAASSLAERLKAIASRIKELLQQRRAKGQGTAADLVEEAAAGDTDAWLELWGLVDRSGDAFPGELRQAMVQAVANAMLATGAPTWAQFLLAL